jgi:MOSC domain-containing protein YiiM
MTPVFSWLKAWQPEQLHGTLQGIFIARDVGQTMHSVDSVKAIPGAGLAGDRYAEQQGHWKLTDGCQVTLITQEDLQRAERRCNLSFSCGEHRRNLVVQGIPLDAFRRRRVRIGDVLFEFHRLRPPCGYLDRLVGRGAGKALGKGAGIGLHVVEGGILRVGDDVFVIEHPRDSQFR